jgi:hypothetical protein
MSIKVDASSVGSRRLGFPAADSLVAPVADALDLQGLQNDPRRLAKNGDYLSLASGPRASNTSAPVRAGDAFGFRWDDSQHNRPSIDLKQVFLKCTRNPAT